MTIDLDFFCFRERVVDDEGQERLIIPWSDPMQYEYPFDLMFESAAAAVECAQEIVPDGEADTWCLIHYTGTIVVPGE